MNELVKIRLRKTKQVRDAGNTDFIAGNRTKGVANTRINTDYKLSDKQCRFLLFPDKYVLCCWCLFSTKDIFGSTDD